MCNIVLHHKTSIFLKCDKQKKKSCHIQKAAKQQERAIKRLHPIGFLWPLFASQDSGILSTHYCNNGSSVASCEACGPSPLPCPQAAVYLENNRGTLRGGENDRFLEQFSACRGELQQGTNRGLYFRLLMKNISCEHVNVSIMSQYHNSLSVFSQLPCLRGAFQSRTTARVTAADIHMQTFQDVPFRFLPVWASWRLLLTTES